MAIKILGWWSTQGWLTLQTFALWIILELGTGTGPGVPGEFLPVQLRREGFFLTLLSRVTVCFLCTASTFNLASSSTTAPSQQLWDHLALLVDLPEVSLGVDLEFFQVSSDRAVLFAVPALAVCSTLPSGCAERVLCHITHVAVAAIEWFWPQQQPLGSPGTKVSIPAFGGCCSCPFLTCRLFLQPELCQLPQQILGERGSEPCWSQRVLQPLLCLPPQSHHFSLKGQLSWTREICLRLFLITFLVPYLEIISRRKHAVISPGTELKLSILYPLNFFFFIS